MVSIGLVFLLCAYLGPAVWVLMFAYHLAVGWVRHLLAVVPSLEPDFATIGLSIIAITIATTLLHRFLRAVINPSWSLKRTVLSTGIFLSLTAAAITMTGIVHELAWLSRSPVITDRGRATTRTETINNGKQVYLAMLEMAQEDQHPHSIEEIVSFIDYKGELFSFQPSEGSRVREPFLLLRPGEDITTLPPETPIIGAFGLDGGRCVIVRADGAVEAPYYKDLETLLHPVP